jgi:exopolysaccharide biosynthesis polyprenyl glycosylphosphotransferase
MTLPQEMARIIVASSAAMMMVILVIFVRAEAFNSRFLVLGYWLLAMIAVMLGRFCMRVLFRKLTVRYDLGTHRVLLIGNDGLTKQLASTMRDDPALGYRVVRQLENPDLDVVQNIMNGVGIDEIILATPDYPAERIVSLVDFCHEQHIVFRFVPNIYQTLTTHYDVDAIGRIPLVQLRRTALDGWGRVFKRCFDIAGSAVALVALSPLFALIAFAIKWETYGPVFVRLPRVSGSKGFNLIKFRGMFAVDADGSAESLKASLAMFNERTDGPLFKMRNDPRITRVGRFIRKYRLDELAQFWNVLKGEMSIVGPRPHQPDEIAKYQKHHKKVLAIKAGATGLAQVSGASDMPFEEEVALDTFYIENWSLMLDVRIAIKTALRMFRDHSAV